MSITTFEPERGSRDEQIAAQRNGQSEMLQMVDSSLSEIVPEDIRKTTLFKEMWGCIGRTLQISFLDPEDMEEFEYLFDRAKNMFLMSKPPYEISFEELQIIKQMKVYFRAAVKRAIGFEQHRVNERTTQASQFNLIARTNSESISEHTQAKGMGAWLKKLM